MSKAPRNEGPDSSKDGRRRRVARRPDDDQSAPPAEVGPDRLALMMADEFARKDRELARKLDMLFPIDPVTGEVGKPTVDLSLADSPDDHRRKDAELARRMDQLLASNLSSDPAEDDEVSPGD